MKPGMLIIASYLSPNLYTIHRQIARYIEERTGYPTIFKVGESMDEFAEGQVDIGFLCGLAYVRLTEQRVKPVELLAAPVLRGERYQGRPVYFSDLVVRRESSYRTFEELGNAVWAYNEKESHSGYNLVYYHLLQRGKTPTYFSDAFETGSHQASLQAVLDGRADVAAIDSHMLAIEQRNNPALQTQLRTITVLGPSTIPPVVASKRLDEELRHELQEVLLTMHLDISMTRVLRDGLIDHFTPIKDRNYHDLREMQTAVQTHTLRELARCVA